MGNKWCFLKEKLLRVRNVKFILKVLKLGYYLVLCIFSIFFIVLSIEGLVFKWWFCRDVVGCGILSLYLNGELKGEFSLRK